VISRRNASTRLAVLLALLVVAPFAARGTRPNASAQPQRVASNTRAAAVDSSVRSTAEATVETPRPDSPVVVVPRPLTTPITASMVESMRAIIARNPATHENVFAKMGGSSVVNRGFLHCFAEEPEVDFGGKPLDETLAYFREARIGRTTPFDRTSLAAAVGWSIRQALSGRQNPVVQESNATGARYALAFFGSNDVEGKNAHQFAGRLDRLVTMLIDRGVVPILGSTYPRRASDREMNEQVRRYNRMSSALAAVYGLPYADFHQAMMPLPGRGLAADGYHPNSYVVGPRSHACDFGSAGMQFGNNHRNLMTMTVLDELRRTLIENQPARATEPSNVGRGSSTEPVRVDHFPFARRLPLEEMPGDVVAASASCARDNGEGRTFVARFVLDRAMRVRVSAVAMGPLETFIGIRHADGTCIGNGEHEQAVSLASGSYEIIVLARGSRRVPEDQLSQAPRTLVVIDEEP